MWQRRTSHVMVKLTSLLYFSGGKCHILYLYIYIFASGVSSQSTSSEGYYRDKTSVNTALTEMTSACGLLSDVAVSTVMPGSSKLIRWVHCQL